MSHHIFPSAGREAFLSRRQRFPDGCLLAPIKGAPTATSMLNSGWNDPVLLPVSMTVKRDPRWESPTVNVLPTQIKTLNKPFGKANPPPRALPALPRTPLQSMAHRSEHWYSDPIHGVFSNQVPHIPARWSTSNRSVFRQRDGVHAPGVSARVMLRIASASELSPAGSSDGFAKTYVRPPPPHSPCPSAPARPAAFP